MDAHILDIPREDHQLLSRLPLQDLTRSNTPWNRPG